MKILRISEQEAVRPRIEATLAQIPNLEVLLFELGGTPALIFC